MDLGALPSEINSGRMHSGSAHPGELARRVMTIHPASVNAHRQLASGG
jgi:hypothetical protein